jgi:hypothetical protein
MAFSLDLPEGLDDGFNILGKVDNQQCFYVSTEYHTIEQS